MSMTYLVVMTHKFKVMLIIRISWRCISGPLPCHLCNSSYSNLILIKPILEFETCDSDCKVPTHVKLYSTRMYTRSMYEYMFLVQYITRHAYSTVCLSAAQVHLSFLSMCRADGVSRSLTLYCKCTGAAHTL